MTLAAGSRLGPYEVLAPLGAGGMGEVYRARDSRLERTVAIKVLPSHLSSSPEVRQRFEREAKTISQLSHPHICALYDVGHQNGTDYLVMEYLEGETLADRLAARGALPLEQVLRYGVEIADALDKAHRQGIVHRDLKPGNVMLTKSGVKLLDFGLAKAMAPSPQKSGLTSLPTAMGTPNLTQEGTILGTFQYMAPEQLEGKEADSRTDTFAFGAVLYEMATGRKAFSGATQASLISAILRDDPPPISQVQLMSPPALDHIVKTCLAKDADERWQSASDLKRELRWIASASQAGVAAPVHSRRKTRERFWRSAALLLFASTGALLWLWRHPRATEVPLMRLSVAPPEKTNVMGTLALSPDGRRIAIVASDASGTARLWVRPVDSLMAAPVVGTEGARYPFWSPDGNSVAFFADGKLRRVALAGGAPQSLCDITDFRGGSWGANGSILFTPNANDSLYRIADTGGRVTGVTSLDPARQDESHRWPVFLPDGRRFLCLVVGQATGIYMGSLDVRGLKRLVGGVMSAPAFAPPGYVLYVNQSGLVAQRFDPRRGEVSGEPLPVAEGIWRDPTIWGLSAYSASTNGLLAYRQGSGEEMQFTWFDRTGKSLGAVGPLGIFSEPWLAPDEKKIAVGRLDRGTERQDIWIHDLTRGSSTRFTFGSGPSSVQTPVWSPDGGSIVYSGVRGAGWAILRRAAAGGGAEESLVTAEPGVQMFVDDWSADGRFLIHERVDPKTKYDLWAFDLQSRRAQPILVTEFYETHAQLSPDGRFLAYVSDETGRGEVYVQRFPVPGGKWSVSSGGGDQPRWRSDGKELFFVGPGHSLMAVDVTVGAAGFEAGMPKKLFSTSLPEASVTGPRNTYLVADRGRRFLISLTLEESSNIQVVVNWTAGLGKK